MTSPRRTPVRVHSLFGVLAIASVAAFGLTGPVGRGLTLSVVSAGVAVSVLRDLLRQRATTRAIWALLFVGFCFLTGNNLLWLVTVDIGGQALPPHPWGQAALMLGYLGLLGAALLMLTPSARRDMGGVLDAVTVGVGGAVVLWTTVLTPALEAADASSGTRAYVLALVLILSAITGALLRAATTSPAARPALLYFLCGVALTLAANVLRISQADPVTGVVPGWVSSIWTVAYLAAWAAAAHPSSAAIAHVDQAVADRLSGRRIAVLGLALAAGPVLSVVYGLAGRPTDRTLLNIAQLLLVALVVARVAQLGAAHAESTSRLARLADHDPLTGLANRRAVDHRLDDLVARIENDACDGAVVLFIDLDDFKSVNDRLGHHTGDDLLTAVAQRLASCVRLGTTDLVGRLGGDEFILVLEGDPPAVLAAARERAAAAFTRPFVLGAHSLEIGASIGTACAAPGTHLTADDLLTLSDHAMYERKRARAESLGR